MTRLRTSSALLAVAVALLGVDLALRLSPPKAVAQEPTVWPPPQPRLVGVTRDGHTVLRLWSDGIVERRKIDTSRRWWVEPEWTEVLDSQP